VKSLNLPEGLEGYSKEFLEWFVGFSDGEANFYIKKIEEKN
jgi:hypothetical protein